MRAITRVLTVALALAWVTTPGLAGIHYTSEQVIHADGQQKPMRMVVDAKIDGENARIEFIQSDMPNPFMPEGSFLLTNDGGQSLFIVNPENGTHMEWSIDKLLQFAGGLMDAMGGVMKMDVAELHVEFSEQGGGDTIHGMPTRHYRVNTSYDMTVRMLGFKRRSQVETVQDLWTTDADDDIALGVWLQNKPRPTGNAQLDDLIEAETKRAEIMGFPLRSVTTTITRQISKKGKVKNQTESVTEMNILTWDTTTFPAGTFAFPDGSQLVEMPAVDEIEVETAESEPEKKKSWKDLLKRDR